MMNLGMPDHRESKERRVRLPKFHRAARAEQRGATRYLLDLPLNYAVFDQSKTANSGRGRTIDLSSSGLRFAAERPIGVGLRIDLAVGWPLTLEGGEPLQLVVSGKVVRACDGETAVRILGYEFRTGCGTVHDEPRSNRQFRWTSLSRDDVFQRDA